MTQEVNKPVTVPKGLSTYAGLGGAALAVLPVILPALSDTNIPEATKRLLIIVGAVLLGLVIISRTAQALVAEYVRTKTNAPRAVFLDGSKVAEAVAETAAKRASA